MKKTFKKIIERLVMKIVNSKRCSEFAEKVLYAFNMSIILPVSVEEKERAININKELQSYISEEKIEYTDVKVSAWRKTIYIVLRDKNQSNKDINKKLIKFVKNRSPKMTRVYMGYINTKNNTIAKL